MKNLFYLLFALPLLIGCDPEDNNGNQTLNSDYWHFKITVNGITQEAEGYGLYENGIIQNGAWIGTFGVEWSGTLLITDPTQNGYISGPNGSTSLFIPNPTTGVVYCPLWGDIFQSALEAAGGYSSLLGYSLNSGGAVEPNSINEDNLNPAFPIVIEDLGTGGQNYSGGTPVKASYTGTVYFPTQINGNYVAPLEINLEFTALR